MKKTKLITLGILLLIIGFFIGRSAIQDQTEVKYIKGSTIIDTAFISKPYKEVVPSDPIYIRDTIQGKVDTLAIIADWITKRDYKQTLFDNDNGKLDLNFSVQYNKPIDLRYSFTPIHKQLPPREKIWQPFVSASYSTLDIIGVGGGLFYYNLGLEYQYQRDLRFNDNGHLFSLKYKF